LNFFWFWSDEGVHWNTAKIILKTNGGQKVNTLFAEAHPDAVLVIVDKIDSRRVPGGQRLWVLGNTGFLE